MSARENIQKAKSAIIIDHPFFASLLLSLPMTEDNNIKTMATDGKSLRYNDAFMSSLSVSEVKFVLCHEVLHCVFMHMFRRGNKNAGKYNIAADYVINDILTKEAKTGTMPKGCLLNSALVQQGGGTTEGVYALLPDSDNDKKPGDIGAAMDDVQDAGQDDASTSQAEAEMRVKVIQAANAAKAYGQLSKGIEKLVLEATKTRTDWRAILKCFLSERAKIDLSYSKPKRRWLGDDIYLPSLIGEQMGPIAIAIDCSGSISKDILDLFASEIKSICSEATPREVHLMYFDTAILKHDSFTSNETIETRHIEGGGTAFSPVFSFIESQGIEPCACVFLTDLECYDFGKEPTYPVMWASIRDNMKAPFGEIVFIKEDNPQ